MKYDIACAGMEKAAQREAVILLGKVFPDYWEQIAAKAQGFPFDEFSLIARAENGELAGHVGVIPFTVSDGHSGRLRLAGIASVAVDPMFRGQGIAAALCEAAADWAQLNGFDALPLFTGKFGVYAHHGWTEYAVNPPKKIEYSGQPEKQCPCIDARNLSEAQKNKIMVCYEQSSDFPGKVFRSWDNAFHGWKRIFREPEFRFFVAENGYALLWDKTVVELCTMPGGELDMLAALGMKSFTLALSLAHPVWKKLPSPQWKFAGSPDDVYHGEGVMLRPIVTTIPSDLYFPCADKF